MKKAQAVYSSFVSLTIIVLLSACAGATPARPLDCTTPQDFCIGLVTELGKIDDQSLNQLAWEGAKRAELKLGVSIQYIETVDSRDYDKNIATFAKAGYDLIITVGYSQRKASIDAARKYPQINFIGVDQPLDPDKSLPQNLVGLSFAEDQLGFLAGALAAHMTKTHKIGAVCGPDTFPPAWRYCEGFKAGAQYVNFPPDLSATPTPSEEPTAEETPSEEPTEEEPPAEEEPTPEEEPTEEEPVVYKLPASGPFQEATVTATPPAGEQDIPAEATVVYHNEIAFNDSLADPEWDTTAANTLINADVDVVFGADSYGENGAVSAAAKRRKYAIGVNTDQYLTIPDAQEFLLSSAVKEVSLGVFDLIKAAKNGYFPAGNFLGKAGYAPYHNLSNRVTAAVRAELAEIQQGLADGSIETGVSPAKP
jgi:basic membrane lipoprotein Med (substrate-binding protein (PBP1-ABC) superfamily)